MIAVLKNPHISDGIIPSLDIKIENHLTTTEDPAIFLKLLKFGWKIEETSWPEGNPATIDEEIELAKQIIREIHQ